MSKSEKILTSKQRLELIKNIAENLKAKKASEAKLNSENSQLVDLADLASKKNPFALLEFFSGSDEFFESKNPQLILKSLEEDDDSINDDLNNDSGADKINKKGQAA